MFMNSFLPDVPIDHMRGVMALLALIGNPQSQAAAEFLQKLSIEKDQAVEASKQAQVDRAAAEQAIAVRNDLDRRERALAEREAQLALMKADLERREGELRGHLKTLSALASPKA